ncbi:unannotated protein [freshwater metagenome]|uniref:Unannotated protein n=1 Tax=freshwater metagenome TaxID=449393 RepID=A0A6J7E7Y7_9ZZZZ|nr:protein-tyrosine-phosphatase [Actinomycetota bacterium]
MTATPANLRDVGGLPVEGGGIVRSGVLLRSDAPYHGDHPPQIGAWPPRTVIDLRAAEEAPSGHPLAEEHGATVIGLSLHDSAGIAGVHLLPSGNAAFEEIYAGMLANGDVLAKIAEIVAVEPGPVLIHCTVGKDRTGVAIAVLLSAIGVPRDAVIADYLLTEQNMDGVVDRLRLTFADHPEIDIDAIVRERADLLEASPEGLAAALDAMELRHGGASGLLLEAGLEDDVLESLRQRLVEPA